MPPTAILMACLLGQAGGAGGDDLGVLRALAGHYEENRSKFDGGRIWFEFTDAYAANAEDAARGNVSDAHQADGLYAFRARDALYRRTFSDASMVATSTKVSGEQVSHRLSSVRMLSDGKVTLHDQLSGNPEGTTTRGTILISGTELFYKTTGIPLDLGYPDNARSDLWRMARLIQDGTSELTLGTVQDGATFDGVKVVRIEVKGPRGKRLMWVDPERGAIPLQIQDELSGGGAYVLHLGDVRMVAGRGWLPHERTEFLTGGRVFRTIVTRVDFGKVPDEVFRLEFPEPIAIVNTDKGLSYRPRKVWELSRLPAANSRDAIPVNSIAMTPDPVMPGERESRTPVFTLVGLGLSAAVVIAVLFWRRRAPAL